MKKQIGPATKAHLLRGAFYLFGLAICAMPFALAQRNTARPRSAANLAAGGMQRDAPASLVGAKAPRELAGAPRSLGEMLIDVPQVPNLSSWTIVAPYPLVSDSVGVTSDGRLAYAAGGGVPGPAPTNSFNAYDPVLNTWTALLDVPTPFYYAPAVYAAITNSIYIFGGIDINGSLLAVTQIYNITNGTWTTGAPMPDGRYGESGAYYAGNGKIYVFGGFDSADAEQDQTWEYRPGYQQLGLHPDSHSRGDGRRRM